VTAPQPVPAKADRGETTFDEVAHRIREGTFYEDYDWASGPALRALDRTAAAQADLLKALQDIFAKLDSDQGAPGHCHDVAGIWDADNAPGVAGTPCEWCAQWERARAAIAAAQGEG
jgi:hypothetical protein